MKNRTILNCSEQIATPIEAIASPPRVAILLAIGQGEACVCHLESALGWRQAYISQHLMSLRRAGILEDRRDGRYVYYRLKNTSYLDLMIAASEICGLAKEVVLALINTQTYPDCECPHCLPALITVDSVSTRSSA